MTSYLARLKAHIQEKKSGKTPGNGTVLTAKSPFRSFHSSGRQPFSEIFDGGAQGFDGLDAQSKVDAEERAAFLSGACGVSQDEATERAKGGMEPPGRLDATVNRIELWLNALDDLPEPVDADEKKLLPASKKFALSVWAHPALAAGWSDGELFGRPTGLVPQMALRNLHLMNIDESGATLMSGRGAVETYERARFRSDDNHPWWFR